MPRPAANPYQVGEPLRAELNTRDDEILDYVDEGSGLEVFNVMSAQYGAAGDGTTNDTTEIQAAIDDAIAAGGGIVYFPPATYLANGLTCAGDNVTLLGSGWGSILRQVASASDNTAMLVVAGTGTSTANNRKNIKVLNLQFYGRSEDETFTEYVHMLALPGVSNVEVRGCYFKAWRGDAIYLGSGFPTQSERHNEDVHIVGNVFDGVDNSQRNGVSIIDGTDIFIERNKFRNVSSSISPGPIDIEPNNFNYARARNIHIENNSFESCSGNVGNVTFDLNPTQANLTTKAQGLFIRGNTFRSVGGTATPVFIRHHQTPAVTSIPNNILIENNHMLDAPADGIYVEGVRGIKIRNNHIANTPQTAAAIGWAFAVMDIELTDNHFYKTGTSGGTTIAIMSVTRLKIARNLFDAIGDGSTGRMTSFNYNSSVPSTSSDVDLVDNRVIGTGATTMSSKDASHTLSASSNRAQGNDTSLTVNTAHFDKQASLTYSRASEPTSAAALRTELAAAKVLVDNTTA